MKTALFIIVALAYLYMMFAMLKKVRKSRRLKMLKYQAVFTVVVLLLLATARMVTPDFLNASDETGSLQERSEEAVEESDDTPYNRCPCNWKSLGLKRNDYAAEHRPAAERLSGNFFIADNAARAEALRNGVLIPFIPDEGIRLQRFQYSTPHLLPLAAERVTALSKSFRSRLRGTPEADARIVISSITRTEAQQNAIQKRYPGTATFGRSTHSFGASVDVLFIETKGNCITARKAFEAALKEMQEQTQFLVCPESNCIHLTAS